MKEITELIEEHRKSEIHIRGEINRQIDLHQAAIDELRDQLAEISGVDVKPKAVNNKHRFDTKGIIVEIVRKAGEQGASSADIFTLVNNHIPNGEVTKGTVLTYLSRMKNEGILKAEKCGKNNLYFPV
jgi:hypothetical protein